MATAIKKGQSITLSTTETAYELDISQDRGLGETVVIITFVSGSFQATAAPITPLTAVLDSTYTTFSTAGDKVLLSINPATSNIRMKTASAGVVSVSW